MAALGSGPIVSTTMAIRATGNSAAGVALRWGDRAGQVPRCAFGPTFHSGFYQRNAKMQTAAAADSVVREACR